MPIYKLKYAYDVTHYYTFYVEATDAEHAHRFGEAALKRGVFEEIYGSCEDEPNKHDEAVYVEEWTPAEESPADRWPRLYGTEALVEKVVG